MQGEIEFVFADVISERIEDLSAFLIPDVGFALNQCERWLMAALAGTAAQYS